MRHGIHWTPLHIAAERGSWEMCNFIIKNTEDKNPRVKGGWTPLHFAAQNGHLVVYLLIMDAVEDKNPKVI